MSTEVFAIVDALRAAGTRTPAPMPPDRLETLRAPGDLPLPPELRAWLAFDATWLPLFRADGAWDETSPRIFAEEQVAEVADELEDLDDWDADEAVDAIVDTLGDEDLADAPAIRLPDSASQAHLLTFHDGKLFVLGYEKESFWVKYATFGELLAAYFLPAR